MDQDSPRPNRNYGALRTPMPDPAGETRSRPRRLILLVEDLPDARELFAEYLNYAGFSVVTAINGHEGIRLARLLRPDLILMDILMPGMDGFEATADLKSDPTVAHIPVVALTADPSIESTERARQAGFAGFITKPARPSDVVGVINRSLDG